MNEDRLTIGNTNTHFLNGEWVCSEKLTVSAFDLVVMRGYGVFDFVKSYDRNFIWLDDYLERFILSASTFQLPMPYTKKQLHTLLNELLTKNPGGDVYVRMLLTGGISEDTLSPGRNHSFMMLVNYVHPIDPGIYTNGVRFITHPGPRYSPRVKSTNYTNSMYARHKYQKELFTDILLTDDSADPIIYEGGVNNVFFVKNNIIYTPPDEYVLGGIIRTKTIEQINKLGLELKYEFIKLSELGSVDEVFATNSSLKVYPVSKINDTIISNSIGPVTSRVAESVNELIENYSKS